MLRRILQMVSFWFKNVNSVALVMVKVVNVVRDRPILVCVYAWGRSVYYAVCFEWAVLCLLDSDIG